MNISRLLRLTASLIITTLILYRCSGRSGSVIENGREPVIDPDYLNVTIPPEIAPLNFIIHEKGGSYIVNASSSNGNHLTINSSDGKVCFPLHSWKKLLAGAKGGNIKIEVESVSTGTVEKYNSFNFNIANESADPWLCYRLLYPGYETYLDIKILQRDIRNFDEKPVVENSLLQNNCVNCHSFRQNDPGTFLLHVRGSIGGTYFVNGSEIIKRDLKTPDMKQGAVYPAWRPDGRFVAFSSNNIVQTFHAADENEIEVIDVSSSLVLYDVDKNEILPVADRDTAQYMETFPEWSSDGKYLYYCRAMQFREGSDFKNIKYDLVKKSFDETSKAFGNAEVVFNAKAINKSVSFPRVSPDGKYLVFTLHDYGNFSIWHKEADLYLLNLSTGETSKMNLNSEQTESWHCWSSNSKWLVFSSKRGDGLTARPYFSHIGESGEASKPFVLPQKDPAFYGSLIKTYNRPEFIKGMIETGPRAFERASATTPVNAKSDSVK